MPVGFDTDVNGAALGEHRWGAAQGLDTFVYLTVGTGLGGGGMVNGKLIHGLMHSEMGHMRIPHDLHEDPYPGWCTYHGDCWEGLTCGPAIEARWSTNARDLPPNHPAWALEAKYLALGIVNIITVLSPQRIIMGGGVMDQAHLFPQIRSRGRTPAQRLHPAPADPGDDRHVHRAAGPGQPCRRGRGLCAGPGCPQGGAACLAASHHPPRALFLPNIRTGAATRSTATGCWFRHTARSGRGWARSRRRRPTTAPAMIRAAISARATNGLAANTTPPIPIRSSLRTILRPCCRMGRVAM